MNRKRIIVKKDRSKKIYTSNNINGYNSESNYQENNKAVSYDIGSIVGVSDGSVVQDSKTFRHDSIINNGDGTVIICKDFKPKTGDELLVLRKFENKYFAVDINEYKRFANVMENINESLSSIDGVVLNGSPMRYADMKHYKNIRDNLDSIKKTYTFSVLKDKPSVSEAVSQISVLHSKYNTYIQKLKDSTDSAYMKSFYRELSNSNGHKK